MSDSFKKGLDDLESGPRASAGEAPGTPPTGDLPPHPSVDALRERFGEAVLRHEVVAGDEHIVYIEPGQALDVLGWLKDDPAHRYDFLADLTAIDWGHGRSLQVVYQLWSMEHKRQLRVKAEVPIDALEIDSVYYLWRAADWLEREVFDLFGIVFRGHPDLRRIMMPYNYAEGHPLRKDFPAARPVLPRRTDAPRALDEDRGPLLAVRARAREPARPAAAGRHGRGRPGSAESRHDARHRGGAHEKGRLRGPPHAGDGARREPGARAGRARGGRVLPEMDGEITGQHMLINIGPQHPATHGVLRLALELDGETVVRCTPHIGYLHSSFEKLGEYRTWNQIIPLTDRMDYLAPLIYNCAYAMAVEKLMGIEVTERCKVVRVIFMEMDRIFSHLLWLGTTAIDLGAFTVFLYTFEQREKIYELHETFTGARITTSATRIGGMMADLPAGWIEQLEAWMAGFPRVLDEVETLLTNNSIWVGRTQGVGVISAEDAINFGLSGANLRASGPRTTCARTGRTTTTRRTTSTSRSASTATSTTAISAAWRRCGRACASCARPSTGCPAGRSTSTTRA
jgi:NADH-quinone oxidoreductase subunit C/D